MSRNKAIKYKIEQDLQKEKSRLAMAITQRLLSHGRYPQYTPVDTGLAISNWRIDSVPKSFTPQSITSPNLHKKFVEILETEGENKTIIFNGLPYINRIMNKGHSKQTPPNSINLIIQNAINDVKK